MVEPLGSFTPLTGETYPEASERTVYLRHDSTCQMAPATCYEPLVTGVEGASNVPAGTRFGGTPEEKGGEVIFVGATPDASHVVLESGPPLTSLAVEDAAKGELYEGAGGELQLVSVLPGPEGKPAEGELHLGGRDSDQPYASAARNAVSGDGSRIVWEDESHSGGERHLYVRDTVSGRTVQLDAVQGGTGFGGAEARFQIASSDVSRVFFEDSQRLMAGSGGGGEGEPEADLYECELVEIAGGGLECKLSDLTHPGAGGVASGEEEAEARERASGNADVLGGVLGASEDGNEVYFVARGALSGTENGERETAQAGKPNLYTERYDSATHEWTTTFIATLSGEDNPDWDGTSPGGTDLNNMTARVSPDGRYLAFMSQRELTGYDNHDAVSGAADEEVYLYDSISGHLVCASCNPSGARPVGVEYNELNNGLAGGSGVWEPNVWLAANIPGWTPFNGSDARHQSRYLSDGGRLFFNSNDALVAQDVNGTEDVYEYEPPGIGDCTVSQSTFSERSSGCVGLISSGTSAEESGFLDASESGGDVFFLTAAKLSGQDVDTAIDVYDAHECTGSVPCFPKAAVLPPPCETADSCKAAPSSQPSLFGPGGSATFSGAGNLTPPRSNAKTGVKPRLLTRAQKLRNALKACAKKPRLKRAMCVRQAHKKYGVAKKSTKKRK